ncbi:MAG: hypothetical protein ACFCUQ_14950 [Kiloniellales bacterium]
MKLLSFPKLRQSKVEQPRLEPTLSLHHDPFAAGGPCERARAVPDGLRQAVTESCPRCGTAREGGGKGDGRAPCLLQGLKLDIRRLDEKSTTRVLREAIGRLEPRLV